MRINQETKIEGDGIGLYPYQARFVDNYNKWMQDEELQAATCSEPLTIEEEYEMQRKWAEDEDKLTFIIVDRDKVLEGDPTEAMVGDVNLFLDHETKTAECEVMIAAKDARRKGFALEAMTLMIGYGIRFVKVENFFAVITEDNQRSMALFEKLGFVQSDYISVFKQYKYKLPNDRLDEFVQRLDKANIKNLDAA
ncbi:unnamed protein product, partial [Mesorhabditis belari]|uniref:N-acetyltransferase domain-containing protein n=1 Tax=Mesorhabditis belari TaxID=2138241 RepID=A0AAF3EH10_9BILA